VELEGKWNEDLVQSEQVHEVLRRHEDRLVMIVQGPVPSKQKVKTATGKLNTKDCHIVEEEKRLVKRKVQDRSGLVQTLHRPQLCSPDKAIMELRGDAMMNLAEGTSEAVAETVSFVSSADTDGPLSNQVAVSMA